MKEKLSDLNKDERQLLLLQATAFRKLVEYLVPEMPTNISGYKAMGELLDSIAYWIEFEDVNQIERK
jgi:hypothetical protein